VGGGREGEEGPEGAEGGREAVRGHRILRARECCAASETIQRFQTARGVFARLSRRRKGGAGRADCRTLLPYSFAVAFRVGGTQSGAIRAVRGKERLGKFD